MNSLTYKGRLEGRPLDIGDANRFICVVGYQIRKLQPHAGHRMTTDVHSRALAVVDVVGV